MSYLLITELTYEPDNNTPHRLVLAKVVDTEIENDAHADHLAEYEQEKAEKENPDAIEVAVQIYSKKELENGHIIAEYYN